MPDICCGLKFSESTWTKLVHFRVFLWWLTSTQKNSWWYCGPLGKQGAWDTLFRLTLSWLTPRYIYIWFSPQIKTIIRTYWPTSFSLVTFKLWAWRHSITNIKKKLYESSATSSCSLFYSARNLRILPPPQFTIGWGSLDTIILKPFYNNMSSVYPALSCVKI